MAVTGGGGQEQESDGEERRDGGGGGCGGCSCRVCSKPPRRFQSWSAGAQSRLSQDCVMVDLPMILTENSCALPLTGNGPDVKVSASSVWCPLCLPGGASLQGLM
ncbi:uncharacterized protein LOC135097103 [Scylla paramamosain]|uniref:uncharacterized protein LOC135097103 n=1 Tax=Scylla paramamosain TaxID=85552 RepID=UPI003082713B